LALPGRFSPVAGWVVLWSWAGGFDRPFLLALGLVYVL
jgi:hypothetical protein